MSDAQIQHATPYLCAKGASLAIDFYRRAFGATEKYRMTQDDGRVGHAEIMIGATTMFISDEWPEIGVLSPDTLGGRPVSFVLEVADLDAAWGRAIGAGAKVERAISVEPHGRGGWLLDPFGHRWNMMTSNADFNPDDLKPS